MLKNILPFVLVCACCVGQSVQSPHVEVVSVKPAEGGGFQTFTGGPGSADPERVTYERVRLGSLIRDAYRLESNQVSGPSWMDTERYTVTATLPKGTTQIQYGQMMASLLAERFGLVFHRVMKDLPGYEITLIPGRQPRLTPADLKSTEEAKFFGVVGANGLMRYTFTKTSMELLTNRLSIMTAIRGQGRLEMMPVNDRTGLSGKFDFYPDIVPPSISMDSKPRDVDDDSSSIADAFQNQIGLRLNRVKIKLEVLVVDHAERIPAEN